MTPEMDRELRWRLKMSTLDALVSESSLDMIEFHLGSGGCRLPRPIDRKANPQFILHCFIRSWRISGTRLSIAVSPQHLRSPLSVRSGARMLVHKHVLQHHSLIPESRVNTPVSYLLSEGMAIVVGGLSSLVAIVNMSAGQSSMAGGRPVRTAGRR
jgi:hypothetical protein